MKDESNAVSEEPKDSLEIPTRAMAEESIGVLDVNLEETIEAAKKEQRERLAMLRKNHKAAVAKCNKVILYHEAATEAMSDES